MRPIYIYIYIDQTCYCEVGILNVYFYSFFFKILEECVFWISYASTPLISLPLIGGCNKFLKSLEYFLDLFCRVRMTYMLL